MRRGDPGASALPPGAAVSPARLANGGGLRNSPHQLYDIHHGLQATTLPVEATTGLDSPRPKPRRWRASQGASKGLQGRNRHGAWKCRRAADTLSLTIEHRAAPSPPSLMLELKAAAKRSPSQIAPATEPSRSPAPSSVDERITAALQDAARPLTIQELRPLCRVRNATLYERLAALISAGQVLRTPEGYRLAVRG